MPYYKTQNNREVDFLALGECGEHRLIQVCETLVDPRTKKQELGALSEAMQVLGVEKGVIVTRNEEEKISAPGGAVEIMPAWRFCLKK